MDSTLHELVVQAAAVHENRKAVCFQTYNGNPICCTYRELIWRAKDLTVFLKSHVNHLENNLIGLFCYPGIHLPSWIIGILQVPSAYFPIDPSAPYIFTSSLIERSKMRNMLVENSKVEMFKLVHTEWIEMDSSTVQHLDVTLFQAVNNEKVIDSAAKYLETNINSAVENDVNLNANSEDCNESLSSTQYINIRDRQCLAYVLHTSGTTGAPKIVTVPHCCIVPNVLHLRSIFSVSPDDLVFLASPLTFDPSVIELFLALSSGACLLIVPDPLKLVPHKLCKLLFHQHKVTVLQVTPTFLRRFGSHSIQSSVLSRRTSLKVLALGGEQCPPLNVLRTWRESGNQTRIFNLYGITEVSSWAIYYEIPESILHSQTGSDSLVPLGSPLHGTTVEVRNDDGRKIEEGEGQLFLGGGQRLCFLDDEVTLPYGTMRRTGDWVKLQDGDMFYLGRKDNQIKRHGKRLNTEYIQQVVEGHEPVETCAVIWFEDKKLVLFVVPRRLIEKRSLWRDLQTHLQSYAVPDDLVLIDFLPLTKHGKIDFSRLSLMYGDHLRKKTEAHLIQTEDDLWSGLQDLWKSILGVPDDPTTVAGDSVFLLSGGDSLKAIRLHEEVEILAGKTVPGLLEIILSDTILDVYRHIIKHTDTLEEQIQDKNNDITPEKKRDVSGVDVLSAQSTSKRKAEVLRSEEGGSFISLSRGSSLFINLPSHSGPIDQRCWVMHGSSLNVTDLLDGLNTEHKRLKSTISHELAMRLQERWASDTGKCVDASPLLLVSTIKDSSATVYIGSHSHRIQALNLHTGTVIWETILGDRVESSAAVSKCGNFIFVGCYDGYMYALRRSSGEIHWKFATGNAVKSSPAVDPVSALAFFGSHDQYLYAVDIEVKQCVWKSHCGGGAIFASPCVSSEPHHLYVATLKGNVLALNPATGKTLWKFDVGKPVFSSPNCSLNHVFVGCVDANFFCLSHFGEKLWHVTTDGPIFSSPCISTLSEQVFFGSHDGLIYSCNAEGNVMWKYKTRSRVYATPFVFPNPHTSNRELLAVASTDGNLWILDAHSGLLISQVTLEGEIFSSPVVCGNTLVVGCRDNCVYCFYLKACTTENGAIEDSYR